MDGKEVRKVLAGLGIVSLVSAAGVGVPGCSNAGSGWSGSQDGTVGADKEKSAGSSGWAGTTDGAVSTEKDQKPDDATKEDEQKPAETEAEKKPTGGSGWAGIK